MLISTEYLFYIGLAVALVLAILAYVFIMPKKRDGKFTNKPGQLLHDFFHFKRLFLEDFLKFTYVLATVACICCGLLMMVGYHESSYTYEVPHYEYYYGTRYHSYSEWVTETTQKSTFWPGLITTFIGPIAVRFVYELSLMFILLVKNVMEINKKLPQRKEEALPGAAAAPVYAQNQLDPSEWICICGRHNDTDISFCPDCGQRNPNK